MEVGVLQAFVFDDMGAIIVAPKSYDNDTRYVEQIACSDYIDNCENAITHDGRPRCLMMILRTLFCRVCSLQRWDLAAKPHMGPSYVMNVKYRTRVNVLMVFVLFSIG